MWFSVECFVSIFPRVQHALSVCRFVTYFWKVTLKYIFNFFPVLLCFYLFFRIPVIAYVKTFLIVLSHYYFFLILLDSFFSASLNFLLLLFPFLTFLFLSMFLSESGCCQWNICFLGSAKSHFTSWHLAASSLSSCIFDMISSFIDMVALFWSFSLFLSVWQYVWPKFLSAVWKHFFRVHICLPFYLVFFSYFLVVAMQRCSFLNEMRVFSGPATGTRFVWERCHVQVLHRHISSSWHKIVFLSEFFWLELSLATRDQWLLGYSHCILVLRCCLNNRLLPANMGVLYDFCFSSISSAFFMPHWSRKTADSLCTYPYWSIEVMDGYATFFDLLPLSEAKDLKFIYDYYIWRGRVVNCVWDEYKFWFTLKSELWNWKC